MPIKAVITDLDGTLLRSDDSISDVTIEAFKRIQAQGIMTIIATGRPLCESGNAIEKINARPYFIGMNGCQTINLETKEELFSKRIPAGLICEAADILDKAGVFYESYTSNKVMCNQVSISKMDETGLSDEYIKQFKGHLTVVDDVREFKNEIIKFFIACSNTDKLAELKKLLSALENVTVLSSKDNFIEIVPEGCNKAVGLKILCDKLYIDPQDLLCIGDSENDIEMLEFCGVGIAVENAFDEVKSVSKYTVCSNDEDGVAVALNEILPKYL